MPVQGWVQLSSRTPQQVPGPGSQQQHCRNKQEQAGARSEASSYVSIMKRPKLLSSAHCWAAHTPAPCRPLLRLSFGEFRRRNATFPLGTQLTAHPISHYIEMCSLRLHYKPHSFTCNCTWLYIFKFF